MDHWLSIEVFDGQLSEGGVSANAWKRAHGDNVVEAALTNGARHWAWYEHRWGVTVELEFADDEQRDRFRHLPAVRAALDAVPDPVHGLLVYPGRGGGSGSRVPRRPRPLPSAGAGSVPVPHEEIVSVLAEAEPPTTGDTHVEVF
jgi:hypothetical protein